MSNFLIVIVIMLITLPFMGLAALVNAAWPIYIGMALGVIVVIKQSFDATKKEAAAKSAKEAEERRLATQAKEKEIGLKIYKKLFEEFDISNINSSEDEEALLVVANSYASNTDITAAKKLFLVGKEEQAHKQKEAIAAKHRSEVEKFKKQKEEADRIGKDKYTYMAQYHRALDIANDALRAAKEAGARNTLYSKSQKQDWATWGGVASALGGSATGFAVASDIQAKNRLAEQRAAESRREAQACLEYYANNPVQHEHSYSEAIMEKHVESRLFSDSHADEWFNSLKFNNIHMSITEGLNFIVQGTVDCPSSFELLGRLSVLDGAVKILIKDPDQKVVATGYFAAPGSGNMNLSAVGFYPGIIFQSLCKADDMDKISPNINYAFEFEPYHLWLIEI